MAVGAQEVPTTRSAGSIRLHQWVRMTGAGVEGAVAYVTRARLVRDAKARGQMITNGPVTEDSR